MEYEDLVEPPAEPKAEAPIEEPLIVETPVPRGTNWKAVILTGLLAGLVGAGGGAAAIYFGLKAQNPVIEPIDRVALTAELRQTLSNDMQALETRISAAEEAARTAIQSSNSNTTAVDLSPVEARLSALEAASQTDIAPETLTALKAAQEDDFEWPDISTLEDRLLALENKTQITSDLTPDMMLAMADRIDALEARDVPVASTELPDELMARLDALENRPVVKAETEIVPLLAFPKAAMIKAVEDNATGGLLKRTLSKHVRVKDEDDPRTLIEGIQADLSEGRLDLALNKYERLPSTVRTAGQAWYASVKQANIKAAQ